jgi:hypothetical protein
MRTVIFFTPFVFLKLYRLQRADSNAPLPGQVDHLSTNGRLFSLDWFRAQG